ncbi:hypothetical protein EWM64_g9443 [Hericium alpestre]|uniref:Uncharacterized protein n=1 Tax=Hericium alpestre TaxID=135208 RepID=A0A4Y9ZM26_9AGAM|nr:hypothetical protein EWM64_g9443 [Hericium alpestre]
MSSPDRPASQAASQARALNATATYTPLVPIAPKPGKPAYDDADFPVYANAVQTLPGPCSGRSHACV